MTQHLMHTTGCFGNTGPRIPLHYLEGSKSATATNRNQDVIHGAQGSAAAQVAASSAAQLTYTAEQIAAAMRAVQICKLVSLNI